MKSRRHRAIERVLIKEYVAEERKFISMMDDSGMFLKNYVEVELHPFQRQALRLALRKGVKGQLTPVTGM